MERTRADKSHVALTAVRPAAPSAPGVPAPAPAPAARPGGWVWVAVGIALVLPLASAPAVDLPAWALRWALLPALAGLGLPLLVAAGRRSPAGRWVVVWLGWAALATALAPQPVVALFGVYRIGTGLVFLAAVGGAWAIGARAAGGARLIANALLLGCAANALVGLVSVLVDLSAFGVAPAGGRAVGFFGNSVYLAELLCGGLWLALVRLSPGLSGRRRGWVVAAGALIAAGIELSGSRAGLILAVAAGVVALWRGRAGGRVAAALVALVVAGGIALGAGVAAIASGTNAGTDRVSTVAVADSGISNRLETWREGLSALGSRPLWGWGPGGTLAAIGPRRTLTIARAEGPDAMFADAHDIVVESAVTTGVVGLILLLGWVGTAVAGARRRPTGEGLLGFAALVVGVSLVEPMHVGVTPLAALALGAAGTWPAVRSRGWGRFGTAVVAVAGMVAAAWLTVGLVALHEADLNADPAAAVSAGRLLPPWGEPDAIVGRLIAFEGITARDPAKLDEAITWWSAAAQRDRVDPSRWNDLAGALEHAGRPAPAADAYERALGDNPWSARALTGLVRIGGRGGVSGGAVAAAKAKLVSLAH